MVDLKREDSVMDSSNSSTATKQLVWVAIVGGVAMLVAWLTSFNW